VKAKILCIATNLSLYSLPALGREVSLRVTTILILDSMMFKIVSNNIIYLLSVIRDKTLSGMQVVTSL